MKLIRFGDPNREKPGILIEDKAYDLSGFGEDYDELFFENNGLKRLQKFVQENQGRLQALPANTRLGSPVCRPSKIVCIGLNYGDHAKETLAEIPKEPIVFFKSTSAITGPNDDLIIPRNSLKTDWEVELAVIIGKRALYVEQNNAMEYIAGYCLHNDYSERAFQIERGGQWVKGKSCDSFAPLGPFLATPEELGDIDNLRLWLKVNGTIRQDSNTSNLIFKVPFLIHYVSQFMSLLPGDIISTGTPPGVALGMKPVPVYLKPGDIIELGIDGLGNAVQHAIKYNPQ
jgi:2,4-diketo-3-deoxy-L-fuconate hydrolase